MPRYTLRTYVQDLPPDVRSQIRAAVRRVLSKDYMPGSVNDLTEEAMMSRLCDLEDTINVRYYLDKANEPRSKGTGRKQKKR